MKAAGTAKTLMTLSTLSTFSIEEVMAVATGPVWFQLYVFKDRAISASLVKRAEVAGCKGSSLRSMCHCSAGANAMFEINLNCRMTFH